MAAVLPNRIPWLRRGALAAGVVAAATLVAIGWFPRTGGVLGLDLKVTTLPRGELAVAPVGDVALAEALQPGEGELRARITLESQAAAPATVRVKQRPSIGDADDALRVQLTASGRMIYDGSAGGLRRPTRKGVEIAPHGSAVLDVRAWLPADAAGGWTGRSVTLPLEYVVSIRGKVRR